MIYIFEAYVHIHLDLGRRHGRNNAESLDESKNQFLYGNIHLIEQLPRNPLCNIPKQMTKIFPSMIYITYDLNDEKYRHLLWSNKHVIVVMRGRLIAHCVIHTRNVMISRNLTICFRKFDMQNTVISTKQYHQKNEYFHQSEPHHWLILVRLILNYWVCVTQYVYIYIYIYIYTL